MTMTSARPFDPRPLTLCFAAALALAVAGHARASPIDLNAEVMKRLDASGQLKALYRKQAGKDLPANTRVSVAYTGAHAGKTSCTANIVLSGPVRVDYGDSYTWVHADKKGDSPLLTAGPKKSAICRMTRSLSDSLETEVGTVVGDRCLAGEIGRGANFGGQPAGYSSNVYEVLTGRQETMAFGLPNARNVFDADGKGLRICAGPSEGIAPGYVKNGACLSAGLMQDSDTYVARNAVRPAVLVLLDPRVTAEAKLEEILPREADRTVACTTKP
jgi:hypothetical protein